MENQSHIYSNETTLLSSLLGKKIMILGHRGIGISSTKNGHLPENTLQAFQMAFIDGADMVELDITLTWDSHIVVFHDDHLQRTTDGIGFIQNYRLEDLRKLDAGKGTLWENQNIHLSTLREVFFFILKKNFHHSLNIEIKPYKSSKRLRYIYRKTIIIKLIDLIDEFKVSDRIIISSFDLRTLIYVRQKRPDLITALLAEAGKWTMEKLTKYAGILGINGIHPHFSIIKTKDEVNRAKQLGLFVQPFVLNTKKEFERACFLGVTGIVTDYPEILYDYLNSESEVT